MARGIDTVAHASALSQKGGRTIAVLGNGLGQVYPPENRKLHDAILDGRGAIFSELPLDMPPSSEHFPRRNRIIAGLCLGVLVVEGRETSGSLITARYAVDMDREVFAVPGPVSSPNARGPHFSLSKTNSLSGGAPIWNSPPASSTSTVALPGTIPAAWRSSFPAGSGRPEDAKDGAG